MNNDHSKGRRSVIAGLGVAAAGVTLAAPIATAQSGRSANAFQPARHDADRWMDELPGSHRIFVDTSTAGGGSDGLLYATNIYNAQINAYEGASSDLAMIVCFRHFSTALGFNDSVWNKYAEGLEKTMTAARPAGLDGFLASVAGNGAEYAICNNATRFFAGQLAADYEGSADDIYDELVAGAIGNSRFVSAGVMALTRAQEYGYSVLVAG